MSQGPAEDHNILLIMTDRYPLPIFVPGTWTRLWAYRNGFYADNQGLPEREVQAILDYRLDEEQRARERLLALAQGRESKRSRYIPATTRAEVYLAHGGTCMWCGATDDLSIEHLIPLSRGGSNARDNLGLACMTCQRRRGNRLDGPHGAEGSA